MSKAILCADDSASMRQMVSFTLESAGYTAVTANDGNDAWAKLPSQAFAMMITDLNMPGMDGISLIRKVRADGRFAGLPIVMLTTESEEGRKLEGKSAGATGWIVKPFDQTRLLAVVKKLAG